MIGRALALLLLMSGLLLPGFSPASDAEDGIESAGDEVVDFDRQVRPILAHYCLPCHGNDGEARKKGLRLDDPESATALRDLNLRDLNLRDLNLRDLNIPAISPGHPENSLALLRISDDDDPMPPDGRERPSVEEIEILTRWVEQGGSPTPS